MDTKLGNYMTHLRSSDNIQKFIFPLWKDFWPKDFWLTNGRRFSMQTHKSSPTSCHVKDLPSRNIRDFTYYLNCIIAKEYFPFFFSRFFKSSIAHLTINFTTLENLFSKLLFKVFISYLLIYHVRQTREHYHRKFKVYRFNL